MGIVSVNSQTGDILAPRNVTSGYRHTPGGGKSRTYITKWVKVGSNYRKAPVKTGYRYDPKRYPKRKQTRKVFQRRITTPTTVRNIISKLRDLGSG